MKKKLKPVYLIAFLVIFIIMLVLELSNSLLSVKNKVEDSLYQSPKVINDEIVVIGIDEYTLSEYGKYDKWIRSKTADLLDYLTSDSANAPKVIGIDITFDSEGLDSSVDNRLANSIASANNVVLTSAFTFSTDYEENKVTPALYEEPYSLFKDSAKAVGHANVTLDSDAVVRHQMSSITYNGKTVNTFDEEIYRLYTGHESSFDKSFYISYSGKSYDYFGLERIGTSLLNVLNGQYPKSYFKDKIVLFGAYATGMQDQFHTPIDNKTKMNGVEIHANVLDQMLSDTHINQSPKALNLVLIFILTFTVMALFMLLPAKIAMPSDLGIIGLYCIIAFITAKNNYLLAVFNPILALILASITAIVIKYYFIFREKRRLVDNYGKYLSPEVAKTISKNTEDEITLGGEKRDIAVLFVDIRGFTTLSEALSPDKVVLILNSYLNVTTTSIFNNNGTVDKFIGDATMGLFNAPLLLEDYTYKAVLAGLEMASRINEVDESLPDELKGRVGFGIGINCGEAIIGNIGAKFRMEYTAIGDTVNTAARLEGKAKAGEVIISEAVYERVKDRIKVEDLGSVSLKGKAKEVKIYKAIGEL